MSASGMKAYSGLVTNTVVDVEIVGSCRFALLDMGNPGASISYLQVFNRPAASVTLGTTAPLLSFLIPATGGRVVPLAAPAILGGSGFSIAVTGGRSDATAPAASNAINIIL